MIQALLIALAVGALCYGLVAALCHGDKTW